MQGILLQIRYFERGLSKRFRTSVCHSHVLVCHPYVTRIYSNAIRMSLVLTRISFVCHWYVLVCHPYVTDKYSYVIRMSLVWTRMPSVCHSYVLAYHSYVTRIYTYVIRMSLVCICMPSVGHSYVLVCHLYVARIYLYVIRMSLVCGFTMNPYESKSNYTIFSTSLIKKRQFREISFNFSNNGAHINYVIIFKFKQTS